ncbi:hypothetical protein FACS1894217_02640 [Clostridia bacterium]|nr:hypothetical protein FACS1894217_02640 [Clostridia bacterium]
MPTNTTAQIQYGDGEQAVRTYYSDYLTDVATPKLVHDQFGQVINVPDAGAKTIEFRKYEPLDKSTAPLTEGVTPDGQQLSVSVVSTDVNQYGGFIELSDTLVLDSLDNNLVQATKLLGNQAGATLDTITREVLNGGTNVQYGNGVKTTRASLAATDVLTVNAIRVAVRTLKNQNAEKIDGAYVAIIHPDVAFDLMSDSAWQNPHIYADTENLYSGEIGRIAGVRFVETTEAKKFVGAGAGDRDVYSTLILADNAYGVTGTDGGGLQIIIKQLGSGGTGDPLNQRASCGWKAYKAAERLVEQYMVRVETTASVNNGEDN